MLRQSSQKHIVIFDDCFLLRAEGSLIATNGSKRKGRLCLPSRAPGLERGIYKKENELASSIFGFI
jgi:hypothetical protein